MNRNIKLSVSYTALILAIGLMSGCAVNKRPPLISYDNDDFLPALVEVELLAPIEIVTMPEPLPLPGQLKPIDAHRDEDNKLSDEAADPTTRVNNANALARMEPAPDGYINAIQVYPFSPGALYRLYTAPEQVSDIGLQVGEKLLSVSAGDTLRWVVGDTTSGQGPTAQVHILIKPTEADLTTNLVITTDRRTYHLELESFETTYMASLSWRYPHDELISLTRRNNTAIESEAQTIDVGIDLNRLKFRYAISGDTPPWRPVRAFDDGHKVYIEFPRGIAQGDAPPLFVVGPEGNNQLVNYRMSGRYYVVDRLFAAAELRLGADPQQIVRLTRTDGRPANGAN